VGEKGGGETKIRKLRAKVAEIVGYFVLAVLAVAGATWCYPNAEYPTMKSKPLESMTLQVDQKGVAASVSVWSMDISKAKASEFTMLPEAEGASCLLVVAVGLDVAEGESVKWALRFESLDKGAKLQRISKFSESSSTYQHLKFEESNRSYDSEAIDLLTGETTKETAHGYLLTGEAKGPLHASTTVDASSADDTPWSGHAAVMLAWRGPSPAKIQGAHVVVNAPDLTTKGELEHPEIPFRTYPAEKFQAVWQETLSGQPYSLQAGSVDDVRGEYWTWRNERNASLTGVFASGVHPERAQADTEKVFVAGILLTIGVACAVAGLQAALSGGAMLRTRTSAPPRVPAPATRTPTSENASCAGPRPPDAP
ncbi:hypothetical protein G6045_35845, partial [Streptomyces sp. YC504]|nr:hypothetical protein [Streptomyces mesophilus]